MIHFVVHYEHDSVGVRNYVVIMPVIRLSANPRTGASGVECGF